MISNFNLSKHSMFLSKTTPVDTSSAWAGHVPFAYFIVSLLKPKILVELGVYTGGSYNAFCQAVKELGLDTECYGVDTWQGDQHTGFYKEELYDQVVCYHREHYSSFSTLLKNTFTEALENFSDHSIDLLHIDGCHTYEAVKYDFETWLPKLKNDGVVILHDICERSGDFGVWRLWEELKTNYSTIEMTHSHGLGVVFLGYRNAETEQFVRNFNEDTYMKLLFEKIGSYIKESAELKEEKKSLEGFINKCILEVEQKERELYIQAVELKHKDAELSAQAGELEHKDRELLAKDRELDQKNRQLSIQAGEMEQKNRELSAQAGELEQKNQELFAQVQELKQKDDLINEVIYSDSWRITAPLRLIGQIVRKVIKYPLQIRMILVKVIISLREVGLINTLKKIKRYMKKIKLEDFEQWLEQNSHTREDYKKIYKNLRELPYQPLISIILPVYNVDEKWLRVCLDSVKSQLYTNWELCIADDASTKPHIRRVLEEYRKRDERIKVIYRQENGHISAASNSALELANGEFIALLDHDDELTVDALYENILLLNEHPEADMIYSDEARIDEDGKRHSPYFKPDWSPDTFLCQMYTCHLGVYRTQLIRDIGGFREGLEGSQDYDLVLRLAEKTNNIYHIPKVLYYWRTIYQSVAGNPKAKEYAYTASYKALGEALKRRGEGGTVKKIPNCHGIYIVNYTVQKEPLISIIISAGDNTIALKTFLKTLRERTNYDNYEIIIIENDSTKIEEHSYYDDYSSLGVNNLHIIRNESFYNYAKMINEAVAFARGELILMLSDEIEILTSDWLTKMAGQALRKSIGAVGVKILNPDDTIQNAGILLGVRGMIGYSHRFISSNSYGYFGRLITNSNYAAVSGECLMIKKELYEDIGGLDEDFTTAYSVLDICLKLIKKGYYNIVLADVHICIHVDKSKNLETGLEKQSTRDVMLMKERWQDLLKKDPFYNPNLTLKSEDFSINL